MLIKDHHPAYITWEAVPRQRAATRRATTRARASARRARAPRSARGSCAAAPAGAGCARSTGRAGASLRLLSLAQEHIRTPACRSVKAAGVDELVARRLLEALAPEEIALALSAADELQDRRARSNRALELRVERARYEAVRAERAFHACEPDNRLVARSLEDRWEEKLSELQDAEAELAEHVVPTPRALARADRGARARPARAVGRQDTSDRDRKRLLALADRRRHTHKRPARGHACGSGSAGNRAPPSSTRSPRPPERHQAHPARGARAAQTPWPAPQQHRDRRRTEHSRPAHRHRPSVRCDRRQPAALTTTASPHSRCFATAS